MNATSKRRDDEEDSFEWAASHRKELEREAASDAPHAWVAESILQRLDDEDVEESDPSDEEDEEAKEAGSS